MKVRTGEGDGLMQHEIGRGGSGLGLQHSTWTDGEMERLLLAGKYLEDWDSEDLEITAYPAATFPSYHCRVYAYCIEYLTYALTYASNHHIYVLMTV